MPLKQMCQICGQEMKSYKPERTESKKLIRKLESTAYGQFPQREHCDEAGHRSTHSGKPSKEAHLPGSLHRRHSTDYHELSKDGVAVKGRGTPQRRTLKRIASNCSRWEKKGSQSQYKQNQNRKC